MEKITLMVIVSIILINNNALAQAKNQKFIFFMPSIGGKSVVINNTYLDNYLMSKTNKYVKPNELSYGRFELEAYHNNHLRYAIQFASKSADSINNDSSAFFRKANMAQIKIGYSLRKNEFIEKLNLIPSIGFFTHQMSISENNVTANLQERTFTFHKTGQLKDNTFGTVFNLKIQYQLKPEIFRMLALFQIGAEADYYLMASSKINRNQQNGSIKFDTNNQYQKSAYGYALYTKLCLPITVNTKKKKTKSSLFEFQHLK